MWILLLYSLTGQPVNHEPYYYYADKAACEADRAVLTDPEWPPLWKGECKQAKPSTKEPKQ